MVRRRAEALLSEGGFVRHYGSIFNGGLASANFALIPRSLLREAHLLISKLGKNKTICGMYVIKSNTINKGNINGSVCLNALKNGTSPMVDTTNRTGPTGGVRFPIIKLRITTIPKCTGSIPSFIIIG